MSVAIAELASEVGDVVVAAVERVTKASPSVAAVAISLAAVVVAEIERIVVHLQKVGWV